MYTLSYVLYGIGALFLISFIVFLVLFLMKKGNKRINLILFIVSIVISVGCFSFGGYHQYDIHHSEQIANDEFADNATKFTSLYKKALENTSTVGDGLDSDWRDGIKEALEDAEEPDTDEIVNDSFDYNSDEKHDAESELTQLKKYLKEMDDYDTGTYDLKAYQVAYDKLERMFNYITDARVTFDTYHQNYPKYKEDAEKAYDNLNS